MLKASYPYYLASRASYANTDLVVTNKYTAEAATRVAQADAAALEQAIAAAADAAEPMRRAFQRRRILQHCVQRFTERLMVIRNPAGAP